MSILIRFAASNVLILIWLFIVHYYLLYYLHLIWTLKSDEIVVNGFPIQFFNLRILCEFGVYFNFFGRPEQRTFVHLFSSLIVLHNVEMSANWIIIIIIICEANLMNLNQQVEEVSNTRVIEVQCSNHYCSEKKKKKKIVC